MIEKLNLIQLKFQKQTPIKDIRKALKEIGLGDSPIQQYKDKRDILIRTYADTADKIIDKFKTEFSQNSFEILRSAH